LSVILRRGWQATATVLAVLALFIGGAAALLSTSTNIDNKPYVAAADLEALTWMRYHLPRDAYVLANPFAFTWDLPPQAVQGSDGGLWTPLVAGVRASVPPVAAYNERPADRNYLDNLRDLIKFEPFADRDPNWDELQNRGITHIYAGSRGGAISVEKLLQSDHANLVFHKDAVWIFELR
jgi:hypothetical protein